MGMLHEICVHWIVGIYYNVFLLSNVFKIHFTYIFPFFLNLNVLSHEYIVFECVLCYLTFWLFKTFRVIQIKTVVDILLMWPSKYTNY